MAFKRKLGSKRSAHPKRKRVSRARHARKSSHSSFAKKVMTVVRKAEMPKTFVLAADHAAIGMGFGTAGYSVPFDFNPNQGVGDGQHLSTRCEIKKVTLQMIITPAPFDATNNANPGSLEVRSLMMAYKEQPQTTISITDRFFDEGTGTEPLGGTLFDMIMPIDKTVYSVYKDTVKKVGHSVYSFDAGAGAASYNYDANNDFKMNQKYHWDITKAFKKTVTFGAGVSGLYSPGAGSSQDRIPSLVVWAAPADGTTGNAAIALRVSYRVVFTYTDF
nr:MAG: capsid protein [Cressdnaviricota sp.]